MRKFTCDNCNSRVFFDNFTCETCASELVFDPAAMTMRSLAQHPDLHACAQRTNLVCNWAAPADAYQGFCLACSLNRTIPNLGVPQNLWLWTRMEAAKRRFVYDVLRLGLPLRSKWEDQAHGLAFDFLSDAQANQPVLTGHDEGLITINLAEADDAQREARRTAMKEPYRTLLGHFRHEVGHFYWDLLIRDSSELTACRAIFGDEREDYATALKTHYDDGPKPGWREHYISAYASSHPWEDWAETFAHFLHIVATLDTAAVLPLALSARIWRTLADPYREDHFEAVAEAWLPLAQSLNELNRSIGASDPYPFVLTPSVIGKLSFVHMIVRRAAEAGEARAPQAVAAQ